MRRKDREITDAAEILSVLDGAEVLHLGLLDGEFPYVVPLHYGYEYRDGSVILYMHGAKEGHKLDLIRANGSACAEIECGVEPVSGGDVPCGYGAFYASVILRGRVEILTAPEEKIRGLELLMQRQTGRKFTFTEEMADRVAVLRFTADSLTAKAKRPAPVPSRS